jgi:phospholipid/cholesterol/gamma-HCH transport system substrate-binding protein
MRRSNGFILRAAGLLVFVGGTAIVFVILFGFAGGRLLSGHRYTVQAVVPSGLALAVDADVRDAGVLIGHVDQVALRGERAVLLLSLDSGHAPVYRDARVWVRTKLQAGGADYVDLDPGHPSAGAIGDRGLLPIQNSLPSPQFDQILSIFDSRTRARLQQLLDELGTGIGLHGQALNGFLGAIADATSASRPVTVTLGADRQQVATLIDDFGQVMRALGDRAASIRTLTTRVKILADAVAARDQDFRATLAALPGFLAQTRATTSHLGTVATDATPVIHNLRLATEQLVPAMAALGPAARDTRAMMHALGRFSAAANPMLARLRPFATASQRFTTPYQAFLRELNPLAGYLAPYAPESGASLANLMGVARVVDGIGHRLSVFDMVNTSLLAGELTPQENEALQALIKAGILAPISARGQNPYAPPGGGATTPEPFQGSYQRISSDPPYSSRAR